LQIRPPPAEISEKHLVQKLLRNTFDPQSWPEREKLLPLYHECGAPFEIIDAAEIRKRWPVLTPREDFIGLFDPLGGYMRPASGNRILAGIETAERKEWRVTSEDFHMAALSAAPELRGKVKSDFISLLPPLGEASWETEKVGLLTFAMDGEPILGPVKQLPGFYVGVAFHSGGFAYNPVTGLLLAEFVADGRTSIDVGAFSPDRFESHEVDEYLATTVAQKDVVKRRH